jgi:hypothetical protein
MKDSELINEEYDQQSEKKHPDYVAQAWYGTIRKIHSILPVAPLLA